MSSTSASSARFQSVLDAAFDSYAKQTGVELAKHPSADKLQNCHSPDDVLQLLLGGKTEFQGYRDKHRKLLDGLRPIVQVVHAFSAVFGEVAGFVPFQPTKVIFVSIDVLLSAAIGVSSSYDALLELFEYIANFLKRLHIYTEKISLSSMMSDIIVQILVEVLSVLALATKEIKQGRFKKFAKKLLGESDVEAITQRLDRLTQEEARMTVTHTLEVVHGIFDNLKVVMADGKASTDGVRKALVMIQQTTDGINRMERNRLQRDIQSWLSPPDPSINHNIARGIYHDGTASWFTESSTFEEWKSNGSLLWVYGKPGSGKSILCSNIIQDLKRLRDTGLALMTYFYFDFKDPNKQQVTGLLASCISQLSAKSSAYYNILSALYSEYDAGSLLPADDALMDCLVNMLKIKGQPTIYIIIDAIDECPNSPGVVPPRGRVLQMMRKLVGLQLENVRILATSRPEADIRVSLESLASQIVPLHEQEGQTKDISDYVRYIVYSDWSMRQWREEDKELVIHTLSQKANGMFRWIVCQLEALMNTFPSAIRRALDDLPQGLDETYDRILQGIPQAKRKIARRLFACLAESFRPLRVEELAEIIAIEFDAGAFPSYDVNWRLENPEEAVLSACSSLITIVNVDGSQVVQFSHFSVKEYLTSERLANAKHLSLFHILPHSAHTVLAQASLGVLLALDDKVNREMMKNYCFAMYAARYWVDHARFEDVSMGINDTMKRLFDATKPHFAAWVWIYDIDFPSREVMFTAHPATPEAVPLYYATLCGFGDIVKHLIITCPQDINARSVLLHLTPLHAAVIKGKVEIMRLLVENGADVNTLDSKNSSPLHEASRRGRIETIGFLLNHDSDIDARDNQGFTALNLASRDGKLDAVRILLDHGATVDRNTSKGWTALMSASRYGYLDTVRMLLEKGATVDSRDIAGWTPLESASRYGHPEIVRMLLEKGATVDSRNNDGQTPLMLASRYGHLDIVRMLLEKGATVDSWNNRGWTPLMSASDNGHLDIIRLLLEKGATVDSHGKDGWTSLMSASRYGHPDIVRMLLEKGATVDSHNNDSWTALMSASRYGHLGIVRMLLEKGATVDSRDNAGWTPLMSASRYGHPEIVHMLLEKGATVDSHNSGGWIPLMLASRYGHLDIVRMLLEKGATVDSRNSADAQNFSTPLHLAIIYGYFNLARLLIQSGANIEKPNENRESPLGLAARHGRLDIAHLLLESGSSISFQDHRGSTPLHNAAENGHLDIVTLLLNSGADFNIRNNDDKTCLNMALDHGKLDVARLLIGPMRGVGSHEGIDLILLATQAQDTLPGVAQPSPGHKKGSLIDDKSGISLRKAAWEGDLDLVRSLLDSGIKSDDRDEFHQTPLYFAMIEGRVEVAKLLIEYRADVNAQSRAGLAPLHVASANGHLDAVQLLLDHSVDVNARDKDDWTPLHFASYYDRFEIVEALLERGVNVHVRNDEGRTPFQEAQRRGKREMMRLLLEYRGHGI